MSIKIKFNPITFEITGPEIQTNLNGGWTDPDTGLWCDHSCCADYQAPAYNSLTHKLGGYAWVENGVSITSEVIELSAPEKTATLLDLISSKKAEITAAYTAADDAILGGYTRQQKERFYKRDAQGCACHLDPNHSDCVYIDALAEGWEPDPVKRPAKKTELCQRAHDLSASIQAATGLIDGKYERLMAEIDAVDPNGDFATEKAKIDAITW